MQTKTLGCLIALLLPALSGVQALPPVNVFVSGDDSRVAYHGVTNPDGTFTTGKLAPGHYVVRFATKSAFNNDEHCLLIISAGKKTLISNRVAGNEFAAAGVAAKMDLAGTGTISGQVADAVALEKAGVKVVNGHRYRWVRHPGNNLGARWVEEDDADANLKRLSMDDVRKLQDRAGIGTMGANEHGPQHDRPGR